MLYLFFWKTWLLSASMRQWKENTICLRSKSFHPWDTWKFCKASAISTVSCGKAPSSNFCRALLDTFLAKILAQRMVTKLHPPRFICHLSRKRSWNDQKISKNDRPISKKLKQLGLIWSQKLRPFPAQGSTSPRPEGSARRALEVDCPTDPATPGSDDPWNQPPFPKWSKSGIIMTWFWFDFYAFLEDLQLGHFKFIADDFLAMMSPPFKLPKHRKTRCFAVGSWLPAAPATVH